MWWWLIFLLGFLFVNNSNSLFSWLIIATYVFFLLGWDLLISLLFSFWASLLFRHFLVGGWLDVVSVGFGAYAYGFSYSFGLQSAYVWVILLLLLITIGKKYFFKFTHTTSVIEWLVVSFLWWGVVSSLIAPRFDLAMTGLISLAIGGFVFLISSFFLRQAKLGVELRNFILASLMLAGLVGTIQYLLRHSLGIFIETRSSFYTSEFMTTDGSPLYRVTGISPHPTFFASLLALLLLPVMGLAIDAYRKKKLFLLKVCFVALGLGLFALIATFSRSSWVAVVLTVGILVSRVVVMGTVNLSKIKKLLIKNLKKYWPLYLLISSIVLNSFYQILDRLSSFLTVWTMGNWGGRSQLIKHSWQMIKTHPFVGVGLNHFPAVMVEQGVSLNYRTFIFPVHNTFLLFLSEMGVVGGGLFIFFVFLVLVKTWKITFISWFNLGVWLGLLTFVINAQFHTLFNQDPSFNIFMLLSGYLVAQYANYSFSNNSRHHY